MEQALIVLPPAAAIVVSVVTLVLTQWRAQRVEDRTESRAQSLEERAAAKSTVDLLIDQNKVLRSEIIDLRRAQARGTEQVAALERLLAECERARTALLERLLEVHPPQTEGDRPTK